MVNVRNDLTGQIYGNFLVLNQADDYISPKGARKPQWNCECLLCGSQVIIMDSVLKKGTKASCGCLNDITNQRFGRLVVLGQDGRDDQGRILWKCECDCGNIISTIRSRLTSKNIQSCGCLRKDLVKIRFSKCNKYDLSGEYGIGWTSNTNKEFYFDLEDYDKIKDYCWFEDIGQDGYSSLKARDKTTDKPIKMSYILGCKYYDHVNRNPLDNRKKNLRPATEAENARNKSKSKKNTSGFSGVCWDNQYNVWLAYIKINKRQKRLGRFKNKTDAIKARLRAELEYYGEFAPQSHLFEEYEITA